MATERSYAKESYKSKPTGVRFNLEQEKIALMRSGKKTRQQLLDFLLENYVKGENPITERLLEMDKRTPIFSPPEIKQPIIYKKVSTLDGYKIELKDAKTIHEIQMIVKVAKNDVMLYPKEKLIVEDYGKELSKDMYTD